MIILENEAKALIQKKLSGAELSKFQTWDQKNRFDGEKLSMLSMKDKIEKIIFVEKDNMIDYSRTKFNRMDNDEQKDYMAKLEKKSLKCEIYLKGDSKGSFFNIPLIAGRWLVQDNSEIEVIIK
jgi:hypothetical protein